MILKYTNSNNATVDILKTNGIKFGGADFLNYSWKPSTRNKQFGTKVKQFNKDAKQLKVKLYLSGDSELRKVSYNRLFETMDRDVDSENIGTLVMDDYYINCYLIDVKVEEAVSIGGDTEMDLILYCPYPFWLNEKQNDLTLRLTLRKEVY